MTKKPTKKSKKDEVGEKPTSRVGEGDPAHDAQARRRRQKKHETPDTRTKAKNKSKKSSSRRKGAQSLDDKRGTAHRNGHVPDELGRSAVRECQSPGLEAEGNETINRQATRIDALEFRIASALFNALASHAVTQRLGRVTGKMRFDWGEIENQHLRPDMAFVSFGRWAPYRHVPRTLTWHVVPNLAIEIVRTSELTEELAARVSAYFIAGVDRVWAVCLHELRILDYDSPSEHRTVELHQCLDGGALLPGFQLTLADLMVEKK
jgi:Uma2 family endonuclease